MAEIKLTGVKKTYLKLQVIHGVDVAIADGEFIVIVGPSGCGKSTLLRMIAGLETITEGEIAIGGRVVNEVEPKDRNIAMVFQNYALYPHMSVYENMSYGLRIRRMPPAEINERVQRAAKILELTGFLDRRPRQLSGGQRQRVAMGRALVRPKREDETSDRAGLANGHLYSQWHPFHAHRPATAAGDPRAPFDFRHYRDVFTKRCLANNSAGKASADQALDHERFSNIQPPLRVFKRHPAADTSASWRTIHFAFSENTHVAAVGVGAEQSFAKAAAEVGAVARGERGRARRYGDLDGGEERPGSGEELRGQRLDLRLGADRHGELESGCRRDAGQIDAAPGMRGLHPRLAVVLVVEHHDAEVRRPLRADGGQRPEPHEHLAVAGHHEYAAARLGEGQAEPGHGRAPHGRPEVEIEWGVPGRGHVVGRIAEAGDDEGIPAVTEDPDGDGAAVEGCGHFSKLFVPMTRWPMSTATAREE
jgi:ABC-type uncharacterized transport system YnjBCD ATPase subunit